MFVLSEIKININNTELSLIYNYQITVGVADRFALKFEQCAHNIMND